MMIRLYILLGLAALFLIGYFRLRRMLNSIREDLFFINDYRNNFVNLVNIYYASRYEKEIDSDLYVWLTRNANKAQRLCGANAVGTLIGPFQMFVSRNHQFIVNTLPKLRDGRVDEVEINATDDALLRTVGSYQEMEEDAAKELKNPLKWFQNGVRFFISFPVLLLQWFGIISSRTFRRITSNRIVKFFTGLAALVAFLSSIVTIFAGWDATLVFIKQVLGLK